MNTVGALTVIWYQVWCFEILIAAQNCTQAGKTCCMDSNIENCRVELSNSSSCYCDRECENHDGDCCSDTKQLCSI